MLYNFIAILTVLFEAAVRTANVISLCCVFFLKPAFSVGRKKEKCISKLSKLNLMQILGLIMLLKDTSPTNADNFKLPNTSFVTRNFFCLFSGVLPIDCVKLWTLNSLDGTGFFYVLEHDMLKTSDSSYILLTLNLNHMIHFRVSELFWQYSKCILMENIFIQTVPLRSMKLIWILSQGFPLQAKLWLQKTAALSQILYP